MEKDDTSLTFKNCADTENGCILGLEMTPIMKETAQAVVQTVKENVNILHGKLGHASIESVRLTAKFYGWTTKDKLDDCEACGLAKSRQMNLCKDKNV